MPIILLAKQRAFSKDGAVDDRPLRSFSHDRLRRTRRCRQASPVARRKFLLFC
jgi:hypothetical protein